MTKRKNIITFVISLAAAILLLWPVGVACYFSLCAFIGYADVLKARGFSDAALMRVLPGMTGEQVAAVAGEPIYKLRKDAAGNICSIHMPNGRSYLFDGMENASEKCIMGEDTWLYTAPAPGGDFCFIRKVEFSKGKVAKVVRKYEID